MMNENEERKVFEMYVTGSELETYKNYAIWSTLNNKFDSVNQANQQISFVSPEFSRSLQVSPSSALDFRLECEHCGSEYTSRKRLQNHYEKCAVLNPNIDESIICHVCKKNFKTSHGYTNHVLRFHPQAVNSEKFIGNSEILKRKEETLRKKQEKFDNDLEEGEVRPKVYSIFHSVELLAISDDRS